MAISIHPKAKKCLLDRIFLAWRGHSSEKTILCRKIYFSIYGGALTINGGNPEFIKTKTNSLIRS